MKVSQIKSDAKQVLNFCEDETLYNRLTQAIEVLANEGQWDSLQAYMDIRVDPEGVVTLPRDVESPIKININNHAAFSHDKLYEFTLNGPGNDMAETSGWAWMDKGRSPVWIQPFRRHVIAFCEKPEDVGKKVRLYGHSSNGRECHDEIPMVLWNTPNPARSANFYNQILRVDKDASVGQVGLFEPADGPDPVPPPEPPPLPPPPPPPEAQVEDVSLLPHPGTYPRNGGAITIMFWTRTPGAHISYTSDGTTPSRTNGTILNHNRAYARVRLPNQQNEGDVTVLAMGFKDGILDSHVTGGLYHITPVEPGAPSSPDEELPQITSKSTPEEEAMTPAPEVPDPNIVTYKLLAVYYGDETAPSYRQIKLTKNASAIRMLYRRKTYQITSDDDWIPLDSTMAILTMLKALEGIRNGSAEELNKVDALFKQALHFLQQEQVSRMQFAIDAQKEIPPSLGITYGYAKGQTGLLAIDLHADAMQIIGNCEDTTFYNRLTHAIEVLSNEGQWDSLESYVDLPVNTADGVVTLPRDVYMPIKVNVNNNPTFSRSKLYEFTVNGPGTNMQGIGWSWVDKGDVVVSQQPGDEQVMALCENLQDIGKKVIIYGYDHFDRECSDILTISPVSLHPAPVPSRNFYRKVTRVLKEVTVGQIGLFVRPTAPPPLPPPPPPPGRTGVTGFRPPPGTYQRPGYMAVRINTVTSGASISYTIDGSAPSRGHGTIVPHPNATVLLRLPVGVTEGTITLRAMAFKDGLTDSAITSGAYHLVPAPVEATAENPTPTTPDTPQFLPDAFNDGISGPPEDSPIPISPEVLVLIAIYYQDEVEPRYRQIKVIGYQEVPRSIRMLYRRRTYKITSDADWIPLNSRMAILTMMRSLEAVRDGRPDELQKVEPYQKLALHFLQQEQAARTNFDIAAQSEKPSTLNLGIFNADSVIAADVYDDACEIFGPIGQDKILEKITDAREFLSNQGQWDGLTGYVDLATDNHYFITLPRYIENVIALNINGRPKMFRNKWFEFHLNGPGTGMPACRYWDDAGETVTIRPLYNIIQPVAYSNLASDAGKVLIIFGLDQDGLPLRSRQGGKWTNGLSIRCGVARRPPGPEVQKISRIDRILKEPSDGFIQLWGYERTFSQQDAPAPSRSPRAIPLGCYYPDETEPNYRRLKLPHKSAWVRMRYRLRNLKVTALADPLHLKNRLAITTAMRALKALEGDPGKADTLENKAINYLLAEQSSRNPAETFSVQFEGLDSAETII